MLGTGCSGAKPPSPFISFGVWFGRVAKVRVGLASFLRCFSMLSQPCPPCQPVYILIEQDTHNLKRELHPETAAFADMALNTLYSFFASAMAAQNTRTAHKPALTELHDLTNQRQTHCRFKLSILTYRVVDNLLTPSAFASL